MEIISSKENQIIKDIRSIEQKKYREKFGIFFVEGEKSVRESLNFLKDKIRYFIITAERCRDFDFVNKTNIPVYFLSEDLFKYISHTATPQGIACVCGIPKEKEFNFDKPFLVLDYIQDPGNLGTIIRTAVATNFLDIFMIDCVDVYSEKVVRSSASAIYSVNVHKIKRTDFCDQIKTKKVPLLIAEATGQNIFDNKLNLLDNYGVIIGNEGQGVSDEILALSHTSISLPMNKNTESLNAAISASVIMYILKNLK